MKFNFKIAIPIFILIIFSFLIIIFSLVTYQKFKVTNTEYHLLQSNWNINLTDIPTEENVLFKNTDNFHGDGLKIIEFKFDSINNLAKSFKFSPIKKNDLDQFINSNFYVNDITNITHFLNSIDYTNENFLYYLLNNNYDSLILLLNKSTKTLITIINYM